MTNISIKKIYSYMKFQIGAYFFKTMNFDGLVFSGPCNV